ncbi:MAG: aminotransferase class III-fold pyridoxal phosphate-dependent enzyme, partial [Kangiellaceae bacterium]|nr:aminotransferase class III-fold pyridoxal phosphate-dependent enzyme [Kangiellaceae bacterium]
NQVMNLLEDDPAVAVNVPKLLLGKDGKTQMFAIKDQDNRVCQMRVISFLPGELWAEVDCNNSQVKKNLAESLGHALAGVDKALRNFSHAASHRYLVWDIRHANVVINKHLDSIQSSDGRQKIMQVLCDYEAQVLPFLSELPQQIIHNDANDYNLLVDSEKQEVSGLFDFGDMVYTFRIAELAIACAYAVMEEDKPAQVIQTCVKAYHQVNPLQPVELEVLLNMIRARLAVSLCMSSYQYSRQPDNDYLLVSQKGAWQGLADLAEIDPIAFTLQLKHLCGIKDIDGQDSQNIIQYRKRHLSENLSLAYQQPLKIVAGRMAYLYNEAGERYLDMVNNVCHVGHCHPKVVVAGQKQMAKLNTNTRYLHDNIIQFSKKLLATMPEQLSVCMFVNSGSEANELALRLARKFTNRKSMVVVEGAYHGNANACIDISPYKFDGAGGDGAPDWVKQTIVPDPFRGKYRGRTAETAKQYALDVKRVVDEFAKQDKPVCAFICESIQGVGGQIIHPPGYLKQAYQYVRDAGGVCIADEVQVGMGRVGTHWWAFETQDVVPDIITIGKPLGNGHPLAAVVTTKEIADAFVTGMEYFNTFGGNPVSCAIGSAVLDIVKEENLQQHSIEVGRHLVGGLQKLQGSFPIIGDVRGLGMFIGAEFVKDPVTLEPATEQIDYVIERLKDEGILLTTEGPFHNVLKIKPPLAFSILDADFFLNKLKSILAESKARI